MRPRPGELLHFSEDPGIAEFLPHVARTATEASPYVWAVDAAHAPSYWFPRQCPRAMAWVADGTSEADHDPHAFVAVHPVRPLGPAEPVGDLLDLHARAGIELRLATSLWPWWHAVTATSIGFSGIRLRNAASPDPAPATTHSPQ